MRCKCAMLTADAISQLGTNLCDLRLKIIKLLMNSVSEVSFELCKR